jgi:hypothetical protein
MNYMQVLSVTKAGECINVEIGHEEEVTATIPNEIGQLAYQVIQAIYHPIKRRVVKASICLTEEEYEILKPAVGDEVEIEIKNNTITFKLIK